MKSLFSEEDDDEKKNSRISGKHVAFYRQKNSNKFHTEFSTLYDNWY